MGVNHVACFVTLGKSEILNLLEIRRKSSKIVEIHQNSSKVVESRRNSSKCT